MKQYYTYIMASKKRGTLYTGMTDDLRRRIHEHKANLLQGFTRRYGVHTLVYFERFRNVDSAILREKRIKAWKRSWKIEMIEQLNPDWCDLSEDEEALLSFLRKQESILGAQRMDSGSSPE